MVVVTNSNCDDADTDSERAVMTGLITISNGDDVDADSECGGDGRGNHYQQWR